jgi:hypothetical protein
MTIKAERNISRNEELLISYTSEHHFSKRQEHLQMGFGFTCDCELCQKGDLGPTGILQQRISTILEGRMPDADVGGLEKVETVISDLKATGCGFDSWDMYLLHRYALRGYILHKKVSEALKACLTIFTIAYNLSPPSTTVFGDVFSLDTLSNFTQMISIFHKPYFIEKLSDTKILSIFFVNYLQFFDKYVSDVTDCFGLESWVAKHALAAFEEKREEMGKLWRKQGQPNKYVLMKDSLQQQEIFVKNVNTLMECAGLPTLTKKELFKA